MEHKKVEEYPIIWLQCAACTGCSVSILNSESPTIKNMLIDEVLPGKHLNLRFHPTIMAGAGEAVIEEMEKTRQNRNGSYILVVEGAIPMAEGGAYGYIGEKDGEPISMLSSVDFLGKEAMAVIALGTCAAFGGIAAAYGNPGHCTGVAEFFKSRSITTPLINIPGCPPHPDWFVGTIASVLYNGLPRAEDLDEYKRPKAFYGKLIHEICPRRADFEEGKFAKNFNEPGCLYELGCKGPVTYADCPIRLWNGGVNWCVNAGSPCIGCCEPGFPDLVSPLYEKMILEVLPVVGRRSEIE
ncbi:MAG: hydrogenase small subunit [Nitrospirae bacterium]|nr:hydrogenase small subunit [Nitrospirota bacterium]